MDHKWLEDFLMLARERNFSKAAGLRHVTQPQFSRRIRALELWAGAELVNRAGVPLALTPAGETLLASARTSVNALADARERIRQAQGAGQWTTLFTGRTLSRTIVPLWLARVRQQVGDVSLRLMTGSMHDGMIALEQGGADFLLSFAHPRLHLALDEQLFEGVTLGHDELLAVSAPVLSASHPGGKPRHALPGTPERPVNCLRFAPQLALAQILQDAHARAGRALHLRTVIESDFAESLHEQALQGVGMAWLPRALVAGDLKSGRLVLAGPPDEAIRFEIRLYRPCQARSPHLQKIWTASLDGALPH
jgi:LysR family transcriptional regulator, hypochlorite-specific transcription factor HypT